MNINLYFLETLNSAYEDAMNKNYSAHLLEKFGSQNRIFKCSEESKSTKMLKRV